MKANSIFISVGILGLLSYVGMSNDWSAKTSTKSLKSSKLGIEHKHSHSTQKLEAPISVAMNMINGPDKPLINDVLTFQGEVKSGLNFSNMNIKWVVPDGAEIISGQGEYTLAELQSGKPHVSEISVRILSEENLQIYFIAEQKGETVSFARSAQYNTQNEGVIKQAAENLKSKHENYIHSKSKAPRF